MKIYTREEKNDGSILVLEKGEAKQLVEALEAACKANKRKKLWRKIKDKLYDNLPLY